VRRPLFFANESSEEDEYEISRRFDCCVSGYTGPRRQAPSDVPVTTYLSDLSSSGIAYYTQSDGQAGPVNGMAGEYDNSYQTVTSVLNANTYNHEPPGDWTLDLLSSQLRKMRMTLSSLNEIQPGQPGYTVSSAQSAFFGNGFAGVPVCGILHSRWSGYGDVNQTIQCPAIFRFDWNSSTYYRVYMTGSWSAPAQYAPETTYVQIQCNSLGTNGYCKLPRCGG